MKLVDGEEAKNYQFDNYELCQLLDHEIIDNDVEFFQSETIQKLIKHQWEIVIVPWKIQFWIYLVLFFIPFCCSIIYDPAYQPTIDELIKAREGKMDID